MIFKIQKPIVCTEEAAYLLYNKNKSIVLNDIFIGQDSKLDEMVGDNLKIYVEGYIDKKDRVIIKRKIEDQGW